MKTSSCIFFNECDITVLRYLTQRNTWCCVPCSLYLWTCAPGWAVLRFFLWVKNIFSFSCPLKQLSDTLCPCLIPWMTPELCVKVIFQQVSVYLWQSLCFHVVDSHADLFKTKIKYSSIHGSFTILMGKHVYIKIGYRQLSLNPFLKKY